MLVAPQRIEVVRPRAADALAADAAEASAPAASLRPARLGVVTTKKIGNAVERNRIRRLCRESFRLTPSLAPPGIDLVVIAKSGACELCLADVTAEWQKVRQLLWKRCEQTLARPPATPHVTRGASSPGASGASKPGPTRPSPSR